LSETSARLKNKYKHAVYGKGLGLSVGILNIQIAKNSINAVCLKKHEIYAMECASQCSLKITRRNLVFSVKAGFKIRNRH